jgi:hypothetical protein
MRPRIGFLGLGWIGQSRLPVCGRVLSETAGAFTRRSGPRDRVRQVRGSAPGHLGSDPGDDSTQGVESVRHRGLTPL